MHNLHLACEELTVSVQCLNFHFRAASERRPYNIVRFQRSFRVAVASAVLFNSEYKRSAADFRCVNVRISFTVPLSCVFCFTRLKCHLNQKQVVVHLRYYTRGSQNHCLSPRGLHAEAAHAPCAISTHD